jgi:hypothetical protein
MIARGAFVHLHVVAIDRVILFPAAEREQMSAFAMCSSIRDQGAVVLLNGLYGRAQ